MPENISIPVIELRNEGKRNWPGPQLSSMFIYRGIWFPDLTFDLLHFPVWMAWVSLTRRLMSRRVQVTSVTHPCKSKGSEGTPWEVWVGEKEITWVQTSKRTAGGLSCAHVYGTGRLWFVEWMLWVGRWREEEKGLDSDFGANCESTSGSRVCRSSNGLSIRVTSSWQGKD